MFTKTLQQHGGGRPGRPTAVVVLSKRPKQTKGLFCLCQPTVGVYRKVYREMGTGACHAESNYSPAVAARMPKLLQASEDCPIRLGALLGSSSQFIVC